MFDPKTLVATMQAALATTQASQAKLQASFMADAATMNINGPGNASAVMASVSSACQDMAQQLQQVAQGLNADLASHQAEQEGQKPADFAVDMPDLRATASQGFPGEQGESFFADLKNKA
jgi:capsule polysaccharide export protein KpsE/RkpR